MVKENTPQDLTMVIVSPMRFHLYFRNRSYMFGKILVKRIFLIRGLSFYISCLHSPGPRFFLGHDFLNRI